MPGPTCVVSSAGEPTPSIEYIRDQLRRAGCPTVTLDEINSRCGSVDLRPQPCDHGQRSGKGRVRNPRRVSAVGRLRRGRAAGRGRRGSIRRETSRWSRSSPTAGRIVEGAHDRGAGSHALEVEQRHVTVLLKPTDFKNDEIMLRGYRPGGHSLAPDEQYISASMADGVVSTMGSPATSTGSS